MYDPVVPVIVLDDDDNEEPADVKPFKAPLTAGDKEHVFKRPLLPGASKGGNARQSNGHSSAAVSGGAGGEEFSLTQQMEMLCETQV
jgi:hypothetical protein